MAVGDPRAGNIYRFEIQGHHGSEVGRTPLSGPRYVTLFAIDKDTVAGASYHAATVGIWKYPGGGEPIKTIGGFHAPYGVTLSPAER